MKPEDDLTSLRSSRLGAMVFLVGLGIWLATAGFLFVLALPVMALGTFLLLFAALLAKHSSSEARLFSACAAAAAAGVVVFLIW